MTGCGFTWLVEDGNGALKIINTYLAGNPLFPSRMSPGPLNQGDVKKESREAIMSSYFSSASVTGNVTFTSQMPTQKHLWDWKTSDLQEASTTIPEALLPIICCNNWEHAHLIDYGPDRRAFVERFWNVINWDRVFVWSRVKKWGE